MRLHGRTLLRQRIFIAACLGSMLAPVLAAECDGSLASNLGGLRRAWLLSDGGVAAFAKLNINIDGYARAYHPRNAEAGSLIHLCNAGRVYLLDGNSYEGSESNATCTGRFMRDVGRIGAAGWTNPSVGVVNWYGILGRGSARVNGRAIQSVVPVLQKDGSGFYVSPTTLADRSFADEAEQTRYVNPLSIAAAVAPRSLLAKGVAMGSFGVAYNVNRRIAVPFVVGDAGPRIGEGSVALARLAAGLPLKDNVTRLERFAGQVDAPHVLWVFFKDAAEKFDSHSEAATTAKAQAAYQAWGGDARLASCVEQVPRN
ncbi:MAG: hypothetical protein GZ092_09900 [Polaromonas sp.]|nr:hypothetical protein [Polaromonas sp.]